MLETYTHTYLDTLDIKPSLLRGDLWSGNMGFDQKEEPIIYDPAVYYGHAEVDIAFTEMFGGLSEQFY